MLQTIQTYHTCHSHLTASTQVLSIGRGITHRIIKRYMLAATALCTSLFHTPIHAHTTPEVSAPTLPSDHAPIAVMGDHIHKTGEWMLSYRFMRMEMDGNRVGRDEQSTAQVLNIGSMATSSDYMVAPETMTMDMHMLGAMYAPSDRLTFMAMLPYLENTMTLRNRSAAIGTFETASEGIGDVKLSALIALPVATKGKVHAGIGVNLPTGSIDEKGTVPMLMGMLPNPMVMQRDITLPYRMQQGSGTYDLLPSITYNRTEGKAAWGAQARAILRTGRNDADYRLGDRGQLQTWLAYNFSASISASLRASIQRDTNIKGQDARIPTTMTMPNGMVMKGATTAQPNLYAGTRADIGVGVNWLLPTGHRFALDLALPVLQDLDGPQMQTEHVLTVGWQKAF